MSRPRKYAEALVNEAMAIYQVDGAAEASRRTGVPLGTIKSMAHRNGFATVALANTQEATLQARARHEMRRELVKALLMDRSEYVLRRIGDDETPSGCQSLATAGAIMIDKHQLLTGEATSRHETRGGDLERTIKAQLERYRQLRDGERGHAHGPIKPRMAIEVESYEGGSEGGPDHGSESAAPSG